MNSQKLLKILFFSLSPFLYAEAEVNSTLEKKILHYCKDHLSPTGILCDSGDFIHVNIDDGYIHDLISFISKDGFKEPPYFVHKEEAPEVLKDVDLVGAHITVISGYEQEQYQLNDIKECGSKITFTLKHCKIVLPSNLKGIEKVFLLTVESKELEDIREKYHLPKCQYAFHITIGIKNKSHDF